jgi:hypothetical protein
MSQNLNVKGNLEWKQIYNFVLTFLLQIQIVLGRLRIWLVIVEMKYSNTIVTFFGPRWDA